PLLEARPGARIGAERRRLVAVGHHLLVEGRRFARLDRPDPQVRLPPTNACGQPASIWAQRYLFEALERTERRKASHKLELGIEDPQAFLRVGVSDATALCRERDSRFSHRYEFLRREHSMRGGIDNGQRRESSERQSRTI